MVTVTVLPTGRYGVYVGGRLDKSFADQTEAYNYALKVGETKSEVSLCPTKQFKR